MPSDALGGAGVADVLGVVARAVVASQARMQSLRSSGWEDRPLR